MNAMAVQYTANARTKMGGAGSGNLNKDDKGANKIILMGYIIAETMFFQAIGDPAPG